MDLGAYSREDFKKQTMEDELKNRFTYHAPKSNQPFKYEKIRAAGLLMATLVNELCPCSHELSMALTKIDEAVMWANAAIARRE